MATFFLLYTENNMKLYIKNPPALFVFSNSGGGWGGVQKSIEICHCGFNLLMPSFACFFYLTDSSSEIYSDISCASLGVHFTFCMQFTGEVISVVVETNMIGLY